MFGWNEKPTTAEIKYRVGGEAPARIVSIGYGAYEVTIPDNPGAVITYKRARQTYGDPRQTFPNMEVTDGEMRIPLDNIVSAVLARVKPTDIAIALWNDADVRDEFIYAMTTRYSSDNIGDADRRKFLDEVKEAVHSVALDRLGDTMAKLEYEYAKRFSLWQEVCRINETLEHYDVTRPPRGDEDGPQPLRITDPTNSDQFKIGGKSWCEARDQWREEVARLFPAQRIEARSDETPQAVQSAGQEPDPAGDAPQPGQVQP